MITSTKPPEKALYVPKGRRTADSSNSTEPPKRLKTNIEITTLIEGNASLSVPQSSYDNNHLKNTSVQQAIGIEHYVPRGRRELNKSCVDDTVGRLKELNVKSVQASHSSGPISATTSLTNTDEITSRKSPHVAQQPRGVYVPKGRRELQETTVNQSINSRPIIDDTCDETLKLPDCTTADETDKSSTSLCPSSNLTNPAVARTIYVPPGRRDLNDLRTSMNVAIEKRLAATATGDEPNLVKTLERASRRSAAWNDDLVWSSNSKGPSPAFNSSSPLDPAVFDAQITDEQLLDCCVLVTGFPTEYPELSRDKSTSKYVEKGAAVRWLGNMQELLAVFKSETQCLAVQSAGNNSSIFKAQRLSSMVNGADNYLTVARELYSSFQPAERTPVVANRLIGAALGIRLPTAMVTKKVAKTRDASPLRVDAWDD